MGTQLNIRINASEAEKIDRLSSVTGMSRPELIRRLIQEASESVKAQALLKGGGDD